MLIAFYIVLSLLILTYNLCFMFKPMFYHVEGIGNICLLLSLLCVVPIAIVGGWLHILIYLGVSFGLYIVTLIIAGIIWRLVVNKFFNRDT